MPLLGKDFGANVYLKMALTLAGREQVALMLPSPCGLSGFGACSSALKAPRLWRLQRSVLLHLLVQHSGKMVRQAKGLDARWLRPRCADESSLCRSQFDSERCRPWLRACLIPSFGWQKQIGKSPPPQAKTSLRDFVDKGTLKILQVFVTL